MNREHEPPPKVSPDPLERWVKIAFYAGLVVLVAWLYFSSRGAGSSGKALPDGRSTASDSVPRKEQSAKVEQPSPKRGDGPAVQSAKRNRDKPRTENADDRDSERDDPSVVHNVRVTNEDGQVIYRGDIHLGPTLDRIDRGVRLRFSHDGSVFENRERRLPTKPRGYYHEFIHPTPDEDGPGGQRVVIGRDGEAYYTPDHYKTFRRVR